MNRRPHPCSHRAGPRRCGWRRPKWLRRGWRRRRRRWVARGSRMRRRRLSWGGYPRGRCPSGKVPIVPSNQPPLGALPARFRRQRLLIVRCGDIGQRVLRRLQTGPGAGRMQALALTSSVARVARLRALAARPLLGNLDAAASLRRLAGLATRVLHLAPPSPLSGQGAGGDPGSGAHRRDPRTEAHRCDRTVALARVLRQRSLPQALVYASTSGVYGDCQGALVPETRRLAPATTRAQRRAGAERVLRELGRAGLRVSLLRIPGIYAADRAADTVQDRLRRAIPVLRPEDDVFTSHIHADDLARACIAPPSHRPPHPPPQPYPRRRSGARLHRRPVAWPAAARLQRE